MLVRFILMICLSLAAISAHRAVASITDEGETNTSRSEQPSPNLQTDITSIPVSDNEIQLAFFAGLSLIFIVMVSILFRKYKGKRRGNKDTFTETSQGDSFTATFISSESSPAILVAQPHNDLRVFITNTLRLNYRVVTATDGLETFEKAIDVVPDMIITDRMMPGMDGSVLCRKLKTTEATSHIPVIILTSREKDMMTTDWHQFADDVMYSTFDARELLMRVHNLIAARRQHQSTYRRHLRAVDSTDLPESVFLDKVLKTLEAQYANPAFGVEQLGSNLGMTRLQLYRKLKALTTYTPGECIRQYRLEQAKQLLLKDGSSVVDVATRCGFSNLPGFTKAFKDYTGKSPVEFAETNTTSDEYLIED